MADWLHCNTCFLQPCAGHQFFLTSCGHIYCSACVKNNTKEKCKMCGHPCTTITLSASMKPDVEIFFTDPRVLAQKCQDQLKKCSQANKQLLQVLDFQKNHRERLTAHNLEKLVKQDLLRTKSQATVDRLSELEKENHILKKLISQMGGSPNTCNRSGRSSPNMSPRDTPTSSRKSPFLGNENAGHTPGPPITHMAKSTSSSYFPPGPARMSVIGPPKHGQIGTIPGRRTPESHTPTPSPGPNDHRNISSMNISPAPLRQPMGTRSAPLPPMNAVYCCRTPDTPRQSPMYHQPSQPGRLHSQIHYPSPSPSGGRRPVVSTPTSHY